MREETSRHRLISCTLKASRLPREGLRGNLEIADEGCLRALSHEPLRFFPTAPTSLQCKRRNCKSSVVAAILVEM